MGTPHSRYWNLTIRFFSIICRILAGEGGSYPSVKKQLVYSAALADWAIYVYTHTHTHTHTHIYIYIYIYIYIFNRPWSIWIILVSIQSNWSNKPIDRTLIATTTPGQSRPGSGGNEGILGIPQSTSCTVIQATNLEGGSYSSAEKQSVSFTTPADWAIFTLYLLENSTIMKPCNKKSVLQTKKSAPRFFFICLFNFTFDSRIPML